MVYLKKLIIKGFKSFARETEMILDRNMNVIVGPNGSGKSNITDALCFVLGRLSIKSMRAAKASHLIFSGNKQFKKANEAYVELVFDNSDSVFAIEENEIKKSVKELIKKSEKEIEVIHYKDNEILYEIIKMKKCDCDEAELILRRMKDLGLDLCEVDHSYGTYDIGEFGLIRQYISNDELSLVYKKKKSCKMNN